MSEHKATVRWERTSPELHKGKYSRSHGWVLVGGGTVPASPAPSVVPVPYSGATRLDPEEAFAASISSCHMLTFFRLAFRHGFQVDRYEDTTVGTMNKNEVGATWMHRVTLHPRIIYSGDGLPAPADENRRHQLANEQCSSMNSVLTEVVVGPAKGT